MPQALKASGATLTVMIANCNRRVRGLRHCAAIGGRFMTTKRDRSRCSTRRRTIADMSLIGVADALPAVDAQRERVATLPSDIAPIRGMNLALIRIEDTHSDDARRPINVGHTAWGGAGGPRSSIGNPDRKRLTLTLYPLGHTRRHSAPDLRESPRTAVFLTGNGLFPGPGGLATQETRVFGAVCLPRGLDMKSLMDTPRRPYHRKQNLPNALRAAARAILDEAGPDVVGLRETARRVGVSATAAYRHFTNKEDLLASIAAEGFRELAASMEPGATEKDPLRGVSLAYVEFALQKRGLFRLMFGPILVQRAKYPELDEAARSVFSLLQRVAVSIDEQPRENNAVGMAAWGLVHGLSSLFIDGLVPETYARGMANAILVQRPRPGYQATA
jgi:AcrR family transcriptional regulator